MVAGPVELVVVRQHDRDHPAERASDVLEQLHPSSDVLLDLCTRSLVSRAALY